jgi:hypothetical protein
MKSYAERQSGQTNVSQSGADFSSQMVIRGNSLNGRNRTRDESQDQREHHKYFSSTGVHDNP